MVLEAARQLVRPLRSSHGIHRPRHEHYRNTGCHWFSVFWGDAAARPVITGSFLLAHTIVTEERSLIHCVSGTDVDEGHVLRTSYREIHPIGEKCCGIKGAGGKYSLEIRYKVSGSSTVDHKW